MFPIIDRFIEESLTFLAVQQTPEAVANRCIKLLKGNGINRLSAHEFTHWLDRTKEYLETALKVDQKGKDVRDLLEAELCFRKKHIQMPIFVSYGKISKGQIVEQPQMRLLSMQRIAYQIIRPRGQENWDENIDISEILDRKTQLLENLYCDDIHEVNPYGYVKRIFNAPAPKEFCVIKDKNDADALTRYLAGLKPILWDDQIYCELRSVAACEYLEGLNIDPSRLSIVRVGIQSQLEPHDETNTLYGNFRWSYHQAVAIKTQEGERFVLDPATDPAKALNLHEWARIYGNGLTIHSRPALLHKEGTRPWCADKYGDSKTAFAISRGEKLPNLTGIVTESHPLLKAITSPYEGP
jgi:hypothetical protein